MFFHYDRKLLSGLSRCEREAISGYLQACSASVDARPAAVNAFQTFGNFLGYNRPTAACWWQTMGSMKTARSR
ncbi:MAG: hypothetical protein R6V84_03415 [Desulfobacterales bacterium]